MTETCPAPTAPASVPSDLAIAVRIARTLLADYNDSSADGFSYPEAYGALAEALRILLRAVGVEPDAGNVLRPQEV
ncbi:hypothetical protein O3Q52_53250, partial [Streptomyces sp. ActVer]|nr:hypothetical protein [Streptomyces sp. ActVer]